MFLSQLIFTYMYINYIIVFIDVISLIEFFSIQMINTNVQII